MQLKAILATVASIMTAVSAGSVIPRNAGKIVLDPLPTELITCTNVTFSWAGGVPPYRFQIYKNTGGLYKDVQTDDTSVTWLVDAAGGKQVNIQMYDSAQGDDFSSVYTGNDLPIVTNGTDTSCVRCAGYFGYQYC